MRAFALIFALILSGCSGIAVTALKTAAGAALGTGFGVSADLQAGKSNSRAMVGESSVTDIRVAPVVRDNAFENLNQDNRTSADERTVSADRVETVVVNQIPAWLLASMAGMIFLFGLVGWMSPQPRWLKRNG